MGLASIISKVAGYATKLNPITSALSTAYGLYSNVRSNRAAKLDRQRNSLSGRVAEARDIGISPLAALGYNAGGTVPGQQATGSGVSGGVDTTLKRFKSPMAQANLRAVNASAARDEAAAAVHRSEVALKTQALNSQPSSNLPPLYIQAINNRTNEKVWLPNPELNIEMPETVGLGYWLRGKYYDQQGKPAKPPLAKRTPQPKGTKYDFSRFPIR